MIEKIIKTAPWKLSKSGNPNFNECIVAKDGGSVCHLTSWSSYEVDKKVIETAPEMLEELIKDWKFIESYLASNASRNDGFWYNEFLSRQKSIQLKIEKATNKTWEEIKELIK